MDSDRDRTAAKPHTTTSYSEAKANELGVNVTRADQPPPPRPEDRPKPSAATTESPAPDIEKALTHLSAAAVEADLGMAASTWEGGESPKPAWWTYRDAGRAIRRAEQLLEEAKRRAERV